MRYVVAALVVVVVLGALAVVKWSQITALIAHAEDAEAQGPPAEAVGTAIAVEQAWEETLDAVGTVASGRDVEIRTEVAGIVTRIAFESGARARRGAALVQLDARVERADLAAAMATEELARATGARTRVLVEQGAEAAQELDRAEAELETSIARVASLRAVIAKKTIRAPMSGRLGIRRVNVGDYLEAGARITAIGVEDSLFVDFSLPQRELLQVSAGMPVRLHLGDDAQIVEGAVAALTPAVDEITRSVGVRAAVADGDGRLRRGMFVDVEVVLPRRDIVVAVPATAIVHASYGDSVFLLEDRGARDPGPRETPDGRPIRTARQTFVRTGQRRGDFVEILEGVAAGREVVSAGAFKLQNGSPVYVDPEGVPNAEIAPRPESR